MTIYRWLPEDAKGPRQHLTIGGLIYGQVYDHPDAAFDPDFHELSDSEEAEYRAAAEAAVQESFEPGADDPAVEHDVPSPPEPGDDGDSEPTADAEGAGVAGEE